MKRTITALLIRPRQSNRWKNIRTFSAMLCAFLLLFVQSVFAQTSNTNRSLIEVNPPDAPNNNTPIAILNGRMIDVVEKKVIEDAVIIIKGNRIVEAGPVGDVKIPDGAEIVDIDGMTVLPGLIDAHLHTINNNRLLNTFLRNGVTTMRDPGHPFRFYQSINFASEQLPRIYLTGAHLDAYPGVYTQQATMIKDHDHIRETIKDYVQQGGSGIKTYFRLPLKYYETVIAVAGFYGIPVVAHLELVAADEAIRAGLKGIEHVTSFGTALADPVDAQEFREAIAADNEYRRNGRYLLWSKIDLESERVKKVLQLASKEKVVLCPTLATFERQEGDEGVADYQAIGFQKMLQFVGMAHQAGIGIVTGSHTSGRYVDHGWAYQREMELLVEAGMDPLEVIASSTIHNAANFRSTNRMGSLEPGKLADLVVVKGDPSVDISSMYDIHKVMLNGRWVDDPEP